MLAGSASKRIKQLSLSKLSTFGLLKGLRQSDVVALMEFLIQQGFISQVETTKFRPVLKISPTGRRLMTGELLEDLTSMMPSDLVNSISLHLRGKTPHVMEVKASPYQVDSEDDEEVESDTQPAEDGQAELNAEVDLDEQADLEANLDEEANEELIEELNEDPSEFSAQLFDGDPTSEDWSELNQTPSTDTHSTDTPSSNSPPQAHDVSPVSKNLFSDQSADDSFTNNHSPANSVATARNIRIDLPAPEIVKPSYYWTWRLLADGYSAEHISQVRQLDRETVFDHAMRAAENDLEVELGWLISESKRETIADFVAANPSERKSNLLSKLPGNVLPQELMYFLKFAD